MHLAVSDTTALPRQSAQIRSIWVRWLVPSLADFFLLALFVWLFVARVDGWHNLLADGDIGWHIRTGDYILQQHSVPQADLFSFSKPNAPWFAWEWLADVIFAGLHSLAGLKGVVLVTAAVIVLWIALLLRQALWHGANVWAAAAIALVGTGAGSIHFLARPHVFSLVFTSLTVWLIDRDRKHRDAWTWLLVPLAVLWVNLHGGFVLQIGLLGLTAVGAAMEARAGLCPWSHVSRFGLLTGVCGAVTLINPYGIHLHGHIVDYLRSDWIRSVVQEFQAPDFRSENQFQFELLLIAGLISVGFLISRRRFVHALWIVVFAHLSLIAARNIPIYVAVCAPLLAQVATDRWQFLAERARRGSSIRILYEMGVELVPMFRRNSLACFAVVLVAVLWGNWIQWPTDFPQSRFPVKLIQRHKAEIACARVLTVDQWADYLIYRFYPDQKVLIDGRSDFYGPELGTDYLHVMRADYKWISTVQRYGIDTILIPVDWPVVTLLKADPSWRVVADDGSAILFTHAAASSTT